MQAVLDMLPTAAYACDRAGRITYFNDRAVTLWGRAPQLNDEADRFCGSHRLFSPDGAAIAHADSGMAQGLRDGRAFSGREVVIERPDGSRSVVLDHISPLVGPDGTPEGAINMLVDVTAQKAAEQRHADVGRRNGLFLATLAHELRNPIAPIRYALPLLRRGGPAAAASLTMVERQVDHLVRLVDDLLEASRVTRGQLNLHCSWIETSSIVASAVEATRDRIQAAGQGFRVHPLPRGAWLNVDAVRLVQAIGNLLDNAVKFTPPGGTIDVVVERDGNMVDIRVRDTGPGIPVDVLPGVFDLFMQEQRWVDGMKAGFGLGLALVKSLVELQGGTVSASSGGQNHGSEFTIRLPVVDAPPETVGVAPGEDHAVGSSPRQRVLIVDDNHDAAESLGMLVELLGNDSCVAFDGQSALAAVPQFRPDLVLLDLSMPGMSGFEVARALRQRPEYANLRIVALSGRSEDDSRRQTREAGFDEHVVKPVDLPALQALIAGSAPT